MLQIASILRGNGFVILLPLAELRDLEVSLRNSFEAEDNSREKVKVYDLEK